MTADIMTRDNAEKRDTDMMRKDTLEKAYEAIENGFPARLVACRFKIDYRELFKLERKRKHKQENFDYFCSWLLKNENEEFKTKFSNITNTTDFKRLPVIPQYWFIAIYIYLKHKEDDKKNKIYLLLDTFSISSPTWRKYKKEILKVV